METAGRIFGRIALAELIALAQREPSVATDFLSIAEIAPAGNYVRRAPVCSDTQDAAELTQDIYAEYISRQAPSHGAICQVGLRDALVFGEGSVATAGGALLIDSCWEFFSQGGCPVGLVARDDGHYQLTSRPTHRIDRPSLLVKRPFGRNYGHWLVDDAALLALLPRLRLPADCQIIVGRVEDPALRAVMRDTLDILAPGMTIIEHPDHEVWQVSTLYYLPPPHISPFTMHPLALTALSDRLRSAVPAGPATRRLYVARDPLWGRSLINVDQVVQVCQRFGFDIVYPERYSLREQIALFQSAQCVVGVKGAALANVLFCMPGARLLALSPSDWPDPFFWDLATQRGVAYAEMFGPATNDDARQSMHAFTIDAQRLARTLATLCPAVGLTPAAGKIAP